MAPDFLARILTAGGSVRIGTMNPEILRNLAAIARQHGSKIEIVGSMNPDLMVSISAAGAGAVTWDLSGK